MHWNKFSRRAIEALKSLNFTIATLLWYIFLTKSIDFIYSYFLEKFKIQKKKMLWYNWRVFSTLLHVDDIAGSTNEIFFRLYYYDTYIFYEFLNTHMQHELRYVRICNTYTVISILYTYLSIYMRTGSMSCWRLSLLSK